MRYHRHIAAVLAATLLFSGCSKKEEPSSSVEYRYQDGIYSAKWSEPINGYTEQVKFEVKNDKVTILSYDAKNEAGKSIKDDEDLKSAMIKYNVEANLPKTYPEQYLRDIVTAFEKTDSDPLQLENVAGATLSSSRFKAMVDETLLMNAMDGNLAEYSMPLYASGKYKVKMPFYTDGWQDYAVVAVKNGKFVVEEADGEDIDGNLKTKDEALKLEMIKNNKALGLPETFPERYYPQLITNFENCEGDLSQMNGIAGATKSVEQFKMMMDAVVESAKLRGPRTLTAQKYKDGTYSAQMKEPDNGWTEFVTIQVRDDRVTVIELDAKDSKGNLKSSNTQLKDSMMADNKKNGLPETFPTKFYSDISTEFYQKDFDVTKMENIAGATVSCNNFKLMVGELLRYNAKNGITEVLVVDALTAEETAED